MLKQLFLEQKLLSTHAVKNLCECAAYHIWVKSMDFEPDNQIFTLPHVNCGLGASHLTSESLFAYL